MFHHLPRMPKWRKIWKKIGCQICQKLIARSAGACFRLIIVAVLCEVKHFCSSRNHQVARWHVLKVCEQHQVFAKVMWIVICLALLQCDTRKSCNQLQSDVTLQWFFQSPDEWFVVEPFNAIPFRSTAVPGSGIWWWRCSGFTIFTLGTGSKAKPTGKAKVSTNQWF